LAVGRNELITHLTLHIGDPKTGTSSIQYALGRGLVDASPQRLVLWEQSNAIALARALQPEGVSKQSKRYGEVRDWISRCDADHAVISSEFFSFCVPAVLQDVLRHHVPSHADTARIIAYVRPHTSRFMAAFIQHTKAGKIFDDIGTFFENTTKTRSMNRAGRFGRWRRQFGEQFTLRPFIRGELRGQDVVTDFVTEVLGSDPFRLTSPVEQNVAVPLQALAGMQLMHRRLKHAGIPNFCRGILGGAMANTFLPMGKLEGEKPELDRATAAALIKVCAADAKKLDRMFFSAPLMQETLERSIDKVRERPIDLTPSLYFSPARKQRVIALSDEIARSLAEKRKVWLLHQKVRKQQVKVSSEDKAKLAENQSYLERVDRGLAELADVLREA